MARPKLELEDSLAYVVYRSSRLLRVQLLGLLAEAGHDLSPEQWFILHKLSIAGGRSQTELGEAIFSDRPNVSRMVVALERKGLVVRTTSPEDERTKLLNLTALGAEVSAEIAERVRAERKRTFRGLSQQELDAAITTLKKLEANVASLLA
jgi:DNA-binding MarR family transcriptional regulator